MAAQGFAFRQMSIESTELLFRPPKTTLPWKIQRLLWIAHQEKENVWSTFPRVLVRHIIQRYLTFENAGVHDLMYESITSCPENAWETLFKNLVVCGSKAKYVGLDTRIEKELKKKTETKVRVAPLRERSAIILNGCQHLAMGELKDAWISKIEFREKGVDHCLKKSREHLRKFLAN